MQLALIIAVATASAVMGVEASFNGWSKELKTELDVLRRLELNGNETAVADGCQCVEYNCGCCGRMVVKKVEFDETICVNASYLPKEYGIRVTLTANDLVLLNQSISAKNPPPLCAGVPHVKELSLCIRFYNLSVGNLSFSGCVDLEAHILHIIDEKVDLGCFKVGNMTKDAVEHLANLKQNFRRTGNAYWRSQEGLFYRKLVKEMRKPLI